MGGTEVSLPGIVETAVLPCYWGLLTIPIHSTQGYLGQTETRYYCEGYNLPIDYSSCKAPAAPCKILRLRYWSCSLLRLSFLDGNKLVLAAQFFNKYPIRLEIDTSIARIVYEGSASAARPCQQRPLDFLDDL